jgi:hypothetical protein
LQDPSDINGDYLNNISRETSRHVRNKQMEYVKDNTDELAMNSNNKNIRSLYTGMYVCMYNRWALKSSPYTVTFTIYCASLYRGINDLKRGYQPRNNLVKDENGDLLADSHNILNRWKKYFSVIERT